MWEEGRNNHYVPKFILNHFGENISCFNVRTGEYLHERNPESVFCDRGMYPDQLEDGFNHSLEAAFSKKLWSLLKGDVLELRRKDLWLIRKFLIISMIRTPTTVNIIHRLRNNAATAARVSGEIGDILYGKHKNDLVSEESDEDYLNRTIECVLNLDGLYPGAVDDDPNGTAMAHYYVVQFSAGYMGFWDSNPDDDFVITDVGMTSENEIGWTEESGNLRKVSVLLGMLKSMSDENTEWKHQLRLYINWLMAFHENFYMFPISAERMIVLINPFFKLMLANESMFSGFPLGCFTVLNDHRLFEPNESTCHIDGEHRDDDIYRYKAVKLTPFQTRYCNALFMDRVDTWLGFTSLDKVRGSAELYREWTGGWYRNDYTILYDILKKSRF